MGAGGVGCSVAVGLFNKGTAGGGAGMGVLGRGGSGLDVGVGLILMLSWRWINSTMSLVTFPRSRLSMASLYVCMIFPSIRLMSPLRPPVMVLSSVFLVRSSAVWAFWWDIIVYIWFTVWAIVCKAVAGRGFWGCMVPIVGPK